MSWIGIILVVLGLYLAFKVAGFFLILVVLGLYLAFKVAGFFLKLLMWALVIFGIYWFAARYLGLPQLF
jgi:hypothetical protein